jgi:hypothetical protein
MAEQDLKNLSTQKLEKRKTFAKVMLWILVCVSVLNIIVAAIADRPELFAVAAAMFAVGYPMYAGMKKVEAELQTRDEK